MPSYAYLKTDLKCSACGEVVTDLLWFQWGFCPAYAPREAYIYKIGDQIYWRACSDGSVPAWVYFEDVSANIGDPSVQNLIVRDSAQYWLTNKACDKCGHISAGAALEIREGVIHRAWLYSSGELDNRVDIYIVEPDGTLRSMPEWNDHPMKTIDNC